jgi:hypothetical protein
MKKYPCVFDMILMAFMFILCLMWPLCAASFAQEAIIIDHTCTDLSRIPEYWINQAKKQLRLSYAHESHGGHPVTGMRVLMNNPSRKHLYVFNADGTTAADVLSLADYTPSGVLGYDGDITWAERTRSYLNEPDNDRNVVIWSWCGGVRYNTTAGINAYLSAMNQLEAEYPSVTFVYMTGHLDGTGEEGNLHRRNNQIRNYCKANGKVLFDFADIEAYDPDGKYLLNLGADDGCYYNDGSCNWAQEWCAANAGSDLCLSCGDEECCAHSEPLNCNLKARAFWWMLARIAGWSGTSVLTPVPDIKANGSDGPVSVPQGSPVSITIALDPGGQAGLNSDWWIVANTPFGPPEEWYSYIYPQGWLLGIHACFQMPLFSLTSFEPLNASLPLGEYIFYFAVDNNADGLVDASWLDFVYVTVE